MNATANNRVSSPQPIRHRTLFSFWHISPKLDSTTFLTTNKTLESKMRILFDPSTPPLTKYSEHALTIVGAKKLPLKDAIKKTHPHRTCHIIYVCLFPEHTLVTKNRVETSTPRPTKVGGGGEYGMRQTIYSVSAVISRERAHVLRFGQKSADSALTALVSVFVSIALPVSDLSVTSVGQLAS